MTTRRRDILLQAAAVGAVAAGGPAAAQDTPDAALRTVFAKQTEGLLAAAPTYATQMGLDVGARSALKHRLPDTSPGAHAEEAARSGAFGRAVTSVPEVGLPAKGRLDRAVVLYAYDLGREAAPFDFGTNGLIAAMSESAGPYVLSQQGGLYSALAELLDSSHKIESRDDAEAFLDRLAASGPAMGGEAECVRRDAGAGVVPPTFILSNALGQMDGQLAVAPGRSRFVETLARKTREKGLAGDWSSRATKLVAEHYQPALVRQRDLLRVLQQTADDRAGVWRLKDGEAYYAWCLKQGTSTTLTPSEVHQLGVEQNAAIGARMNELLKAQGLTTGSVGERMTALGSDPRFAFPDTDAGRQQALDYLRGRVAAMRTRMDRVSALPLKAPVEVRRVPVEIQDGAGLAYMNPAAADGSRPSIYYMNLKTTSNWPKFSIPSVSYHETIPGHAWQFAYIQETHAFPEIRQVLSGFNAYVEGWALYSEQLADEVGMYDDDPWGRLGYLQAQKFRAVRLVVDTGLHAQRWTREQAVTYAMTETGRARPAMESEIDRYVGWPGQACGYKVGHTEIVRLREKARAALGPRFDLVAYDDAVIRTGSAPLTVLADEIDRWTAARRAA